MVVELARRAVSDVSSDHGLKYILRDVKRAAAQYRVLTGRSLGVTGWIAKYEAARLLDGLELCPRRQIGYDAVRRSRLTEERLQINGRVVAQSAGRQRLGAIRVE